jgi:hypothetical protein
VKRPGTPILTCRCSWKLIGIPDILIQVGAGCCSGQVERNCSRPWFRRVSRVSGRVDGNKRPSQRYPHSRWCKSTKSRSSRGRGQGGRSAKSREGGVELGRASLAEALHMIEFGGLISQYFHHQLNNFYRNERITDSFTSGRHLDKRLDELDPSRSRNVRLTAWIQRAPDTAVAGIAHSSPF